MPSPTALKNKILVKAKRQSQDPDEELGEESEDDERDEKKKKKQVCNV